MSREKYLDFAKAAIVCLGGATVALSVWWIPSQAFTSGFILLALFSVIIAPRMSLVTGRASVAISFSDSVIFLAFLLYGPECAVLIAALEALSSCYYNKWSGSLLFGKNMIAVNTLAAATTAAAALVLIRLLGVPSDRPERLAS